jgi:hypothetical protein
MKKNVIKEADKYLYAFCLVRADYKCEKCGNRTDDQDPHHILPKSVYPQHRHNPSNIAILCRRKCHIMAEDHPQQFALEIALCGNLDERHTWALENVGKNKYPIDVDYDENFRFLMETIKEYGNDKV